MKLSLLLALRTSTDGQIATDNRHTCGRTRILTQGDWELGKVEPPDSGLIR